MDCGRDGCTMDAHNPCKYCGDAYCVAHRSPGNHDCPNVADSWTGPESEERVEADGHGIGARARGSFAVWKARFRYGTFTVVQGAFFLGVVAMAYQFFSIHPALPRLPIPTFGHPTVELLVVNPVGNMIAGALFAWVVWMLTY